MFLLSRMINNLTLKGHVENLASGQGHDLILKGHVAYHSIRIVGLNTSIIYGVFIALAGLYQKLYPKKTAGDLLWPEITLATWRGVTGHNIPTQVVKSTCNPMFESVCIVFVQKRRLSFFSHWLIYWLIERSQNWPDLRSPISKFRDTSFIDTGTNINRWKFQGNRSGGVALPNIQTFYEVRSLDVTWWPDLAWPGSEISTTYAEKTYDKVCQKRRRALKSPLPHQGEG